MTTLDQVIASNVTRLREANRWTMNDLADRLGVSRHVVLAYEGRRADRGAQRPFRWTELVTLCYALEVTLYELVLPADSDTEVRDPAFGPLKVLEVVALGWPRRNDLGYGLFGLPGETLLDIDTLKGFEKWVQKETDRRLEVLHRAEAGLRDMVDMMRKIAEKRPGITGNELLDYGGTRTLPEILELISDEEEE